MKDINWKIFKCHPDAIIPTQQPGSAGFDIFTIEPKRLFPNCSFTFHTGIKCSFTPGYVALLWDRSGLGIQDLHRTAGVIDANYRGEWMIHLTNIGKNVFDFIKGDRIAQVIFQKLPTVAWGEVSSEQMLGQTQRGESGFGSSGR